MHHPPSDKELLDAKAQVLGVDALTIMRRYYGSPGDARYEIEQLERTGKLQESLVGALSAQLDPPARERPRDDGPR